MTEAVYSSPPPNGKARTLAALTANCHFSQPKRHLGSKNPPILPLEPTSLVLDELHLLLRIGDVLLRNLILHADSLDQETYMASERRTDNHIRSLELHINRCGVSFSIALVFYCYPHPCVYIYTFQVVNENNKPVSGLFTWTALTRRDKLKVLKNLPTYLPELLPSPDATKIALLWKV